MKKTPLAILLFMIGGLSATAQTDKAVVKKRVAGLEVVRPASGNDKQAAEARIVAKQRRIEADKKPVNKMAADSKPNITN